MLIIIGLFCYSTALLICQTPYQITYLDNPAPGYILSGPQTGQSLALYDNSGNPVFTKDISQSGYNANSLRILDNGNLAFFCPGKWLIMDRNLNIIDSALATPPYTTNFHTLRYSPGGGYLIVGNQMKHVDMSAKVLGGNPNANVWNVILQEFDLNKNLVFEWSAYDHIEVTDATEDISMTANDIDPYHINSACYDYDGNILANFRNLDELIKINRQTGQIMWIMGGSKSRKNQFTFYNDYQDGFFGFSHQHDPKRLPNGNILLFDNGNLSPNPVSRAVEYQINEASKTATKVWDYRSETGVFARFQGNAQRLPNGNTMIGWGDNGTSEAATEVTPAGDIVMKMSLNGNTPIYQVLRSVIMMSANSRNITSSGTYSFTDMQNNTGVSINVASLTTGGFASIEKHNYLPKNLSFSASPICNYLPSRWVLNYRDIVDLNATLYLDLSSFSGLTRKSDLKVFWREKENSGSFVELETSYNQQMNRLEAAISNHGEFIVGYTYNFPPSLIAPVNNEVNQAVSTTLKWSASATSTDFSVQISPSPSFDTLVTEKVALGKTELTCDFLSNNSKYYWRVKGNNSQCDNKYSDYYSFSTEIATAKLTTPGNNSTGVSLNGMLIWSEISGASSYRIQISDDPKFQTFIVSTETDSLHWSFANFKPLKNYYWRVSATNTGIYKNWSQIFTFKTGAGKIALSNPQNMLMGAPTNIKLSWTQLDTIKRYEIQLSRYSNFQKNIIDTIISYGTEFQCPLLFNSTTYYWRIKGFFADTSTDWSDTWQFRTIIAAPVLYLPMNKSADNMTKGRLDWYRMDDADSYQVQISADSAFKTIISDVTTRFSFFYYGNLNYFSHYYWRVRASDPNKITGAWSAVHIFYTVPMQVFPMFDSYMIPLRAMLKWNTTDSTDFYELRIASDSAFKSNCQIYTNIIKDYYIISNLQNNKMYYWSIRTVRSGITSAWSFPFRFTTQLLQPIIKLHDTIIATANELLIEWKSSVDMDFYRLQIATDSAFSNLILSKDSLETEQYRLNNKLPDSVYYYRIMAYNSRNISSWSDIGSFKVQSALSVDYSEIPFTNRILSVYPNPATSEANFNFRLNSASFVTLEINAESGSLIEQLISQELPAREYSIHWNPGSVPQGVYFYRLRYANTSETGRLVITK